MLEIKATHNATALKNENFSRQVLNTKPLLSAKFDLQSNLSDNTLSFNANKSSTKVPYNLNTSKAYAQKKYLDAATQTAQILKNKLNVFQTDETISMEKVQGYKTKNPNSISFDIITANIGLMLAHRPDLVDKLINPAGRNSTNPLQKMLGLSKKPLNILISTSSQPITGDKDASTGKGSVVGFYNNKAHTIFVPESTLTKVPSTIVHEVIHALDATENGEAVGMLPNLSAQQVKQFETMRYNFASRVKALINNDNKHLASGYKQSKIDISYAVSNKKEFLARTVELFLLYPDIFVEWHEPNLYNFYCDYFKFDHYPSYNQRKKTFDEQKNRLPSAFKTK